MLGITCISQRFRWDIVPGVLYIYLSLSLSLSLPLSSIHSNWMPTTSRNEMAEPLVDYILLAEFDIDTGSTVRHQYPAPIPGYKNDWFAELMLPEGAHNRDSDWTYIFLNRDQQQMDEKIWINANAEVKPASSSSERFMYGINLVQTKMDTTVRRGAIVKAMAIFSRYHYTDIFRDPLRIALETYFEAKDVSVLENLYQTLNGISTKQIPCPNYLEQNVFAREVAYYDDKAVHTKLNKWVHTATIKCFDQESVSVQFPFYRCPDEICSTNVRRLTKVLGSSTMRVLHGLITRQRILFIGYNHSAADISNIVLSSIAMVSPPIPNIIRRTYPYAALSDLSFMETEG